MSNAVVVTGFGVHSAFGRGADALRGGVFAGVPAFAPTVRFDTSPYRTAMAATAAGTPVMRGVLAGCAADAFEMADLATGTEAAVLLGTAGDVSAVTRFWRSDQIEPSAVASTVPAAQAHLLAEDLGMRGEGAGWRGPRLAFTNACVASANAIIHGARLVGAGLVPTAVCAGAYLVEEEQFAKFDSGRALARDGVIRPFSADRSGLLLGDGVAVLILETEHQARCRGVRPLARISGWGMAADAHHIAKPHPDGAGIASAITQALRRAGTRPDEIDYINAHGTGTKYNDGAETRGVRAALGDAAQHVPVSSTKSTTGHTLEAAGAMECVISLLALGDWVLPPTAGYTTPDPECDLDCVPHHPRAAKVRRVISTNSAFGGINTAILMERL